MVLNDPLSNALSHMLNCEKVGKTECTVEHASKLLQGCFKIIKEHGYIGDYEVNETRQGTFLKVQLTGSINKCGVIKPRFSVKTDEFEKYERRYLPAKDFGVLIVSTPYGLMTHNQAKEKQTGGRLIAYMY